MLTSIPSSDVYAVDVPDVDVSTAEFVYNFHTPDETINDRLEGKHVVPTADDPEKMQDVLLSRIPRFNRVTWSAPVLNNSTRVSFIDRPELNNNFLASVPYVDLTQNIENIISEDSLTSGEMVNISFQDAELNDRSFTLVSSSLLVGSNESLRDTTVDAFRAAFQIADDTGIDPTYLYTSISNKSEGSGLRFFDRSGSRLRQEKLDPLRTLTVNAQLNTDVAPKILEAMVDRPNMMLSSLVEVKQKLLDLTGGSTNEQKKLKKLSSMTMSDVVVPYCDVNAVNSTVNRSKIAHVGYVIEKTEVNSAGSKIEHPPIIINDPATTATIDVNVRYGTVYLYAVKAIYRFELDANEASSGDQATLGVLVSSLPNRVFVRTVEFVAPPPPTDISVRWDFTIDRPVITWAFPNNRQRDVKHFQVFRRRTIDEPFELMKHYDFDDSLQKEPLKETVDKHLIVKTSSPTMRWVDRDFDRSLNDEFIYTIGCVDAHGFVSNYGVQIRAKFNNFKNKLMIEQISHSGAPRAYPNMYLNADALVDVVHLEGRANKNVDVYFNPAYFNIVFDDGRKSPTFRSKNTGSKYIFQFTNVDNAGSATVDIEIDDARSSQAQKVKQSHIANIVKSMNKFVGNKLPFTKNLK